MSRKTLRLRWAARNLPIDLAERTASRVDFDEEPDDDLAHDAREIRECIRTISGVVERLKHLRAPTMLTKRAESSLAATGLYLFAWRTEGDA